MQLSLMLTEVPGKNSVIAMCKRSGAISFEKSSGDELVEWVTGFLKVLPREGVPEQDSTEWKCNTLTDRRVCHILGYDKW